jgi:hypothetical protein
MRPKQATRSDGSRLLSLSSATGLSRSQLRARREQETEPLAKRIQRLLVDTFETSLETAELVAEEIKAMIDQENFTAQKSDIQRG